MVLTEDEIEDIKAEVRPRRTECTLTYACALAAPRGAAGAIATLALVHGRFQLAPCSRARRA